MFEQLGHQTVDCCCFSLWACPQTTCQRLAPGAALGQLVDVGLLVDQFLQLLLAPPLELGRQVLGRLVGSCLVVRYVLAHFARAVHRRAVE